MLVVDVFNPRPGRDGAPPWFLFSVTLRAAVPALCRSVWGASNSHRVAQQSAYETRRKTSRRTAGRTPEKNRRRAVRRPCGQVHRGKINAHMRRWTFRRSHRSLPTPVAADLSPWWPGSGQEHETGALHLNRSWTGVAPVQMLVQGREDERKWLPFRVSTFLTTSTTSHPPFKKTCKQRFCRATPLSCTPRRIFLPVFASDADGDKKERLCGRSSEAVGTHESESTPRGGRHEQSKNS